MALASRDSILAILDIRGGVLPVDEVKSLLRRAFTEDQIEAALSGLAQEDRIRLSHGYLFSQERYLSCEGKVAPCGAGSETNDDGAGPAMVGVALPPAIGILFLIVMSQTKGQGEALGMALVALLAFLLKASGVVSIILGFIAAFRYSQALGATGKGQRKHPAVKYAIAACYLVGILTLML